MKRLLILILAALLAACGDHDTTSVDVPGAPDGGAEIGQAEQGIASKAGNHFVMGVCNNRSRDKCSIRSACPGSVECVVPATKAIKFVLKGIDTFEDPVWDSWKNEFRRAFTELGTFPGQGWSGVETTELVANVVVTRGTCACTTPNCDTMADLACFQEPAGLGRVVLSESLPGTYIRPATATQKRYVFVDIDRLLWLARFDGRTGRHFGMEHLSRWVAGTLVGLGSETNWISPDGVHMPDEWWKNNAMAPYLATDVLIAVHRFNFENQFEDWEYCLMTGYSLVDMGVYTSAPVGCP